MEIDKSLLEQAMGKTVFAFYKEYERECRIIGILNGYNETGISIQTEKNIVCLDFAQILKFKIKLRGNLND